MVSRPGLIPDGFLGSPFRCLINYAILQWYFSLTMTSMTVLDSLNIIWRAAQRKSWKNELSNSNAKFLEQQKTITGNSKDADLYITILNINTKKGSQSSNSRHHHPHHRADNDPLYRFHLCHEGEGYRLGGTRNNKG